MLLALVSPAGNGQLAVEKNELYLVFIAFAKFIVGFNLVLFTAIHTLRFFGIYALNNW